jgi:hypothetical protein
VAYDQIFISQTVAGVLMWRAVSYERTDLSLTVAAGPHECILGFDSRETRDHVLLSPPTTRRATIVVLVTDRIENTVFNNTPIVLCVFTEPVPMNTCFFSRSLHSNGTARYNTKR